VKHAWKSKAEVPFGLAEQLCIEPSGKGFWSYRAFRRSAGASQDTPIHERLKWILEQINLGHVVATVEENGDVVALTIGKGAPLKAAGADEAADLAGKALVGLDLVGLFAESREKGTSPTTHAFEKSAWESSSEHMRWRIEIHYGLILCELLGRVSEKLPKLGLLPILENAPERTLNFLAEATRCYLFKLDRACIALCRACLEDALNAILTPRLNDDWMREMEKNKRTCRNPQSMRALIEVCLRDGVLRDLKQDAHYVRKAANKILHMKLGPSEPQNEDVAGNVLNKTRMLIGSIHGRQIEPP